MTVRDNPDTKSLSVNVRISGTLRDHVERTTTEGDYESVSEYVRDLIRKDKARRDQIAFDNVKARLKAAFAEPRSSYEPATPGDIKVLAKRRAKK